MSLKKDREIAQRARRQEMRESLQSVIDMLATVPDEQFNMAHWWLKDGMAFDDDRNKVYRVADGPCGCVVGHLIQRGLLPESVIMLGPGHRDAGELRRSDVVFIQISDALKLYNSTMAKFLFCHYSYLTPFGPITRQDVIRRIEFILTEIAEPK